MAITERTDSAAELQADLDEVRRLVEAHAVEEARRLAPQLAAKWPDSPAMQHWARGLEPPKILPNKPGPPGRSFARDYAWFREHGHEYPGCWIATLEDRLIAADPDLNHVLEEVRRQTDPDREMTFLHH